MWLASWLATLTTLTVKQCAYLWWWCITLEFMCVPRRSVSFTVALMSTEICLFHYTGTTLSVSTSSCYNMWLYINQYLLFAWFRTVVIYQNVTKFSSVNWYRTHNLWRKCSTLYVVQATLANFGLHAVDMRFNAQEWRMTKYSCVYIYIYIYILAPFHNLLRNGWYFFGSLSWPC